MSDGRAPGAVPWLRRLVVLMVVLVGVVAVGCGGGDNTSQGVVVEFGQSVPPGGGMVESFVVVRTEGGEEVEVWLPNDDAVWGAMSDASRTDDVTISYERDGESWVYVDVVGKEEAKSAQIVGDALPILEGSSDPAIGMSAPGIRAATLAGEGVEIDPADGVGRLVVFLAHWDPHGQKQVPVVVDWLADEPLPEGVELVAIATASKADASNYPPSEWLEREGLPGTLIEDDDAGSLASGYGVSGFPFWVAVGGDGTVVDRAAGEQSPDQLRAMVSGVS